MQCKKCHAAEAFVKGMCRSCYMKERYKHHKAEVLKRYHEHKQLKREPCPVCGHMLNSKTKLCPSCAKHSTLTLAQIKKEIKALRVQQVRLLREQGLSYREIGNMLNVTKQRAEQIAKGDGLDD